MKLTGFCIKINVICTIPLLRKPSLITFRLYSKTAQIQNLCGVSINQVCHRSSSSSLNPPSTLSADQFSSFFVDKIKALRSKLPLVDLNPFTIPERPPPIFSLFQPASIEEIKHLILSPPKSTCSSDPVPSNLLPLCIDATAPVITRIVKSVPQLW